MAQRITVIGGGPGGYTAAFAAAEAGADVTLVEKAHLGGTCLNHGCIPTKTLRATADALELAEGFATLGIDLPQMPVVNMPRVKARKDAVINILRTGISKGCTARNITVLQGEARLCHAQLTYVRDADGAEHEIAGDAVIIATGSRVLDIPGLTADHTCIVNSDDMLELDRVPQRILVVGGGVVGCEMACIYQAFGASVTVVEGMDRLLPLPSVDADVSTLLQREMKKRRITCQLGRTLKDVRVEGGQVCATLCASPFIEPSPKTAQEIPLSADMVLVSIGRGPQTEGLGLDAAGVKTDARGWICADAQMRTSVPGIYAIGDVLGPGRVMLAHVAAAEGLCAVRAILGQGKDMAYDVIPSCIFTAPEIGCVGMSEGQAQAAGLDVATQTVQVREMGKAHAMNALPGIMKLVAEKGSGRLLGAHLVGAHSSDMIAEITLALQMKASVRDVAGTIHAHPTLAEGIYEAATRIKI